MCCVKICVKEIRNRVDVQLEGRRVGGKDEPEVRSWHCTMKYMKSVYINKILFKNIYLKQGEGMKWQAQKQENKK